MIRALLVLLAVAISGPDARADQDWPGSYPEGPVWIDGTLYWAEMYSHRVMAWRGGTPEPFFQREGCGPTAIARYRERELIVLCHLEGALAHLDGEGGLIATIDQAEDGLALRDPNDASSDGNGGVWFTDPGVFSKRAAADGALLYLSPEGRVSRHATGLAYGNGVHVDQAVGRLLVSEHLGRRVLSYPLTRDGLGAPQTLIDLEQLGIMRSDYPEAGPDGLEIDPQGRLWVALYGEGRLLYVDGNVVRTLEVDTPFVTNVAFSADGRMATTGAFDNARPPFAGVTRVMPLP